MLLAVVGLLILAIGMYTSYNLSRTVYEKIQLQNAADATAYSLATIEARTFNFIAFANRAQIANYVQMLEAQSLLSSATFVEGLTAWGGDFALSAGDMLEKLVARFPWLSGLEGIAQILKMIGGALETTYEEFLRPAVDRVDDWTPRFIQLQTAENQALFAVSALMVLTTGAQVADGAFHISEANDPDARRNVISFGLNLLNAASYVSAFDSASLSMNGNDHRTREAKRLMVEMAHAARYGTPTESGLHQPELIVARGPFELLEALLGVVQGGTAMGGPEGKKAREYLGGFVNALERLVRNYIGTAKMLSAEGGAMPDLDDTGRADPDHSALALGDALVAKDTVRRRSISLFPKWHKNGDVFASVISTRETGVHCRYDKRAVKPRYGTWRRLVPSAASFPRPRLWSGEEFVCDPAHGRKHTWKALMGRGGIQPYIKFLPKKTGLVAAEPYSFNQPDVWIFLNKGPEAMELDGGRDLDFEIGQGRRSAELDARIGEGGLLELGIGQGMNVFSRAQVYYHRPGAWQEPPNFFNPYWGARLAPTNAVIKRLGNEIGLGGMISRIVADTIWTH